MKLKITDIRIRRTFPEGSLKAIVSVTVNSCLAVHDIKIIQSSGRLFAAMPSRRDENGIFRDIIHPIDTENREYLEKTILSEYSRYAEIEKILNAEENQN